MLFLERLLLLYSIIGSIWEIGYMLFTCYVCSRAQVKPPSPSPQGSIRVFPDFVLRPSFIHLLGGGMGSAALPSVGE